ncbi:thiamine transport system ATP-binding protein [Salinihabitans flavidus]|uniref:Thiamine transport system ATP-binding protein n=1 Tax=Salinihabitans flavidus TaxID=569882 RepID=A0A1H8LSV2_9RHOB|nr:thiamine ABC transporter ATP-binding protein [Salinihabitans flavidus]SEO08173.1 thiamine transport system ATP-binding protein [Salinihabitans flavidus]
MALTIEGLRLRQEGFGFAADLEVTEGARVAVIGPSGAGKSTLLAAIAGFLAPESGRILWQGRDITHAPPGARPVAILFQDNNLFPHLSVAQNVGLGIRPDLKLSAAQRAQVEDALERVGLAGMGARRPGTLSGGQQSRAALARVLVQDRPVVLLDEPFSALGPALRNEMLDLMATLLGGTGATLLLVSHDPADARRIAEQTILVAEGVAHPPRETGALFDDPPEVLRDYLG